MENSLLQLENILLQLENGLLQLEDEAKPLGEQAGGDDGGRQGGELHQLRLRRLHGRGQDLPGSSHLQGSPKITKLSKFTLQDDCEGEGACFQSCFINNKTAFDPLKREITMNGVQVLSAFIGFDASIKYETL